MPGSPDPRPAPRHFIAVNHHRFHAPAMVEPTVRSVLAAADRLRRARPDEGVRVTLFVPVDGLAAPLLRRLLALPGLCLRHQKGVSGVVSNGAGLNAQMELATAAGAGLFYRVDADDPVHPDRFVRQARLIERSGAHIAGGGLIYRNVHTGRGLPVLPPAHPHPRDFLENCAMLHPTLAFDLVAIRRAGLRYWSRRLEDKNLGLQAARAGLRIVNDSAIYGDYTLNPQARQGLWAAWTNLSLNLAYLRHCRRPGLMPRALLLFLASAVLPSQWLRVGRHRLRAARLRHGPRALRPCSGSACGSEAERTTLPRGE